MLGPIIYNDDDLDVIEEVVNNIEQMDQNFQDTEKIHGQYYIGGIYLSRKYNQLLMMSAISPRTFFRYDAHILSIYLYEMSIVDTQRYPRLQIMQLDITRDGDYCCVLKTFWLRLIQRTWKRVFAQKMATVRRRGSIPSLKYSEIHGRYPDGLRYLPGLYGMLSYLAK